MASRDIGGRREIEAAKQRLSAAKSHDNFISKTLLSAKAAVVSAKAAEGAARKMLTEAKKNREDLEAHREEIEVQATSSKKDLSNAQKFLDDVEKRWEVIAIDIDDDAPKDGKESGNKNKKRKASASPQGDASLTQQGNQSSNENTDETVPTSIDDVKSIIVSGCGTAEANGTYKRYGAFRDSPCFIKVGQFQGKTVQYELKRPDDYWYIGVFSDAGISGGSKTFYRSMNRTFSDEPPPTSWMVVYAGEYPAPQSIQFTC